MVENERDLHEIARLVHTRAESAGDFLEEFDSLLQDPERFNRACESWWAFCESCRILARLELGECAESRVEILWNEASSSLEKSFHSEEFSEIGFALLVDTVHSYVAWILSQEYGGEWLSEALSPETREFRLFWELVDRVGCVTGFLMDNLIEGIIRVQADPN